jgi:purine nucleosidase
VTSLTSSWTRSPLSSGHVVQPRLSIDDAGNYRAGVGSPRRIHVYTSLDVRLVLEDFYAKLAEFAQVEDVSLWRPSHTSR